MRLQDLQILPLTTCPSSPCKPWRAGGTKYAFCPQLLQRLKDYALASRQEYKWLVVDPSLFLAACSLLYKLLNKLPNNGGSPDARPSPFDAAGGMGGLLKLLDNGKDYYSDFLYYWTAVGGTFDVIVSSGQEESVTAVGRRSGSS